MDTGSSQNRASKRKPFNKAEVLRLGRGNLSVIDPPYVYAAGNESPTVSDKPQGSVKLFVFGDSYVDTGNWKKSSAPWKEPYGITFPGKPSGRFSDGRVLTDYIGSSSASLSLWIHITYEPSLSLSSSYLGNESPVPFTQWTPARNSSLKSGMNFAYGGTGVFDTGNNAPNMNSQINFFQQMLEKTVLYTKQDLQPSIALVSSAGNDYPTYIEKTGNDQDLPAFTRTLIDQLSKNLKRIHGFGVQKIMVTSLPPLGCLPTLSSLYSYQNCSEKWNAASMFHNQMLDQEVQRLNSESTGKRAFEVLNLYSAFTSVLNQTNHIAGNSSGLESPMKPCCLGVESKYFCGNIDSNGVKKYKVCNNTGSSIFWDMVHPSQNGWHSVYLALKTPLHMIY
ncbi:hypothetical protein Tsubulata_036290 [Turnera subulata]|uniref:SGNH hydrolase-type esterase domain-containing protein n=1 Tax=Turnera subulata TaxID=218843 RepID=A0A9Q0F7H0_9ROSI|nr:hypothetical protein Tsubulata_036290 [Turnera subulata]